MIVDVILAKIFGTKTEREIKSMLPTVAAIGELEPGLRQLSDIDLAAKTIEFKERIAHGILTASFISALIGTKLPGYGAIYISQTLSFRRPVKLGDEVLARVEVKALDAEKARVTLACICSVGGKSVLEGEAVAMAPRRA